MEYFDFATLASRNTEMPNSKKVDSTSCRRLMTMVTRRGEIEFTDGKESLLGGLRLLSWRQNLDLSLAKKRKKNSATVGDWYQFFFFFFFYGVIGTMDHYSRSIKTIAMLSGDNLNCHWQVLVYELGRNPPKRPRPSLMHAMPCHAMPCNIPPEGMSICDQSGRIHSNKVWIWYDMYNSWSFFSFLFFSSLLRVCRVY